MIRILILALALAACTDVQATMPDAALPSCAAVCDQPDEPRLCTRLGRCSCEAADGSGEIGCETYPIDAGVSP